MAKKTPKEIMAKYVPSLPNKFYAFLVRALIFLLTFGKKVKFSYSFDKKQMRGKQVILIADHSSTDNYLYALRGYPFVNPNVVIGYQNIFVKGLFGILLKVGVIPKRLYVPDATTTVSLLRLARRGASFLLFPEGIQSMAGATQPINPATAALLKKLKIPVVLCKSYGAYLNRPRFDSSYRKGPMEFSYQFLFTQDDLERMTSEELYTKLLEQFSYNDFLWNSDKRYTYKGRHKNAYGLDKILFVCPICGRQFSMHVDGDEIVCECKNRIFVNERYDLVPQNGAVLPFRRIDEWFLYQRDAVHREVSSEGFSISYDAEYLTLDTVKIGNDKCIKLGEGRITIDRERFLYEGSKDGERFTLSIPISLIPSSPFVSGRANEFFYENDYYRFVPKDNAHISVKILLIIEELHNMTDKVWRRVSDDVYRAGGRL